MLFFGKNKKKKELTAEPLHPLAKPEAKLPPSPKTQTTLFFPEELALDLSEQYVYRFHHAKLPVLQPNQISIRGIKLGQYNEGLLVQTIIYHTVPTALNFDEVELAIQVNGDVIARQTFNLYHLGNIPANSAFPWEFLFNRENMIVESVPEDNWEIVFQLRQSAYKLRGPASLTQAQMTYLENVARKLPEAAENTVHIHGVELVEQNGQLSAFALVRNSYEQTINLDGVTLKLLDRNEEVFATATFEQLGVEIDSMMIQLVEFKFAEYDLTDKDTSAWRITN